MQWTLFGMTVLMSVGFELIAGGTTTEQCKLIHRQSYVKPPKTALIEFNTSYSNLANNTTKRIVNRRTRKIKRVLSNHVSKPMITIDDLL
ncbi:hypothetical protein [Photobacterium piscicola]|uniref:hypothetical protein n=1 Tax=Photobacterium piscicola TaxID=1378299 RepID=UPI003734F40D